MTLVTSTQHLDDILPGMAPRGQVTVSAANMDGANAFLGTQITAGTITTTQISNTAGIKGSQLAAAAAIAGTQLAANAAIAGTQLSATAGIVGTQLSATAGIVGSQLSATAGIVGGQIAATTITSSNVNSTVKIAGEEIAGIRVPKNLSELDYYTASTPGDLVRNFLGDWSINITAGGAETHTFSSVVPYNIVSAGKGAKLTGVEVAYQLGVADATSVDVLVNSVVYAQALAPSIAVQGGAIVDGSYDTGNNTAAKRADRTVNAGEHLAVVTLPTPAYFVTAGGEVRIEAIFVLKNTGTLKVRSLTPIYSEIER